MPTQLPVRQRKSLDNSILESVARCPRLGFYNYYINRSGRGENYPINFGIVYHKFRETLERMYIQWCIKEEKDLHANQKVLFEVARAVAVKDWKDPPIEHKKGYLDLGRLDKTFDEAFESWLSEKSRGVIKIIGTETAFELPLDGSGRLFSGRLDQIIEWNRRLWVRDFKTVGRKSDWSEDYNPAHQFTGYVWAAQKLSGRKIEGVIVDVIYNIKTKGPEFHPIFANRTSDDIRMWQEWVESEYDNWERYIATDTWPMRTTGCGDYGGCYFRECCNRGNWPSIENWLEEKTIHSFWDPMNPDREEGIPE